MKQGDLANQKYLSLERYEMSLLKVSTKNNHN